PAQSAVPHAQRALPTRRSSDLARSHKLPVQTLQPASKEVRWQAVPYHVDIAVAARRLPVPDIADVEIVLETGIACAGFVDEVARSEEHTSELQSRENLVCRLRR